MCRLKLWLQFCLVNTCFGFFFKKMVDQLVPVFSSCVAVQYYSPLTESASGWQWLSMAYCCGQFSDVLLYGDTL